MERVYASDGRHLWKAMAAAAALAETLGRVNRWVLWTAPSVGRCPSTEAATFRGKNSAGAVLRRSVSGRLGRGRRGSRRQDLAPTMSLRPRRPDHPAGPGANRRCGRDRRAGPRVGSARRNRRRHPSRRFASSSSSVLAQSRRRRTTNGDSPLRALRRTNSKGCL